MLVYDDGAGGSGGAHVLSAPDPDGAWHALERFLSACGEIRKYSTSLRLRDTIGPPKKARRPAALLRRARQPERGTTSAAFRTAASTAFGHPNRIDARIAGDGSRTNVWDWPFEPPRMGEALRILMQNPVSGLEGEPAAVLLREVHFLVKDPATGEVLSGREARMVVTLAGRSTCSLVLPLPFEEVNEEAIALIARLQERLPFPLSPERWALR
jgi:hypothetical protein